MVSLIPDDEVSDREVPVRKKGRPKKKKDAKKKDKEGKPVKAKKRKKIVSSADLCVRMALCSGAFDWYSFFRSPRTAM